MTHYAKLKKFAKAEYGKLKRKFPVYDWEETRDPIKLNAIYPREEWTFESPSQLTGENRDWIHIFACDPSAGCSLQIFLERLKGDVARAWVNFKFEEKTYVLKETFFKDNSTGTLYSAGSIRLECTAPLRFWRVSVNAIFTDDENGEKTHVRIGGRVSMVGHTCEIPKEVSTGFLAHKYENDDYAVARGHIRDSCSKLQAYFQPISMITEIIVDGKRTETALFGTKLKFVGNSDIFENTTHLIGYAEKGVCFGFMETQSTKCYGFNSAPTSHVRTGLKANVSRALNGEKSLISSIKYKCDDTLFTVNLDSSTVLPVSKSGSDVNSACFVEEFNGTMTADGEDHKVCGTALRITKVSEGPQEKILLCEMLQYPSERSKSLILSATDPECRNPALTGGKGSSLAVLTELSSHFKTFTVPSAIVLTTDAYEVFASTPEVKHTISEFLEKSKAADLNSLKEISEKCVSWLSTTTLPEEIEITITESLKKYFGDDWETKKYAVRSSAVGEDSEEMSAAGQMTTFLGMKTKQQICEAVVNCWASQFALTAVNYKRQYGQELNSSMAVVIQEMVSADCAGVMFTCDPVNSDPSCIFITANFGLGESVVSAFADPDTYSLKRDQSVVTLLSKTCGAKDKMIVQSEHGKGTEERSIAGYQARSFCLSDDKAVKIATIGTLLSDITDTPRDIEWAVVDEKVFLLQSRPVTSFLKENDFEIQHDLDSGMYTNREILSRANLDEVMPGVFSPLTIAVLNQVFFETFTKTKMRKFGLKADMSQYSYKHSFSMGKKCYMNYSHNPSIKSEEFRKSSGVTVFGFDISENEALKNGIVHTKDTKVPLGAIKAYLSCFRKKTMENFIKQGKEMAANTKFEFPENADSMTILNSILSQLYKINHSVDPLMGLTIPSSILNTMALNILKGSQGVTENTPEIMVLLSKVIRSDYEVESATIPKELNDLSNAIRKDKIGPEFSNMSIEDALLYLETDNGEAAKLFRFLREKHAHRCYKEFDVHSKTWDIDPTTLIKTLQMNVSQEEVEKKEDETLTIDTLPKRPSYMQRKLLNFIIPRTKLAVYGRESTKSSLIKCLHQARIAFRKLGKQMFVEGRIPDPDLVFFLTPDELHRVILSRDPILIMRAIRRQKMHPTLDQLRYPVLLYGIPKPIISKIQIEGDSVKGTPVSEGIIEGSARVILDFLTEAHTIQKGDILVTRATDTGWTPYFPLLGGVVTEVGGLLSHGAVVAREYGLPAVVGVPGATDFVKSGDLVVLDGNNGIITRKTPAQPTAAAPESEDVTDDLVIV